MWCAYSNLYRRGVVGVYAVDVEKPLLQRDDTGKIIGITFDEDGNPIEVVLIYTCMYMALYVSIQTCVYTSFAGGSRDAAT
jgi:hypothetical protein